MKKTHSANIGGRVFQIDEDAYEKLRAYLQTIEAHFDAYPDIAEIIADIEARIAEQLLPDPAPAQVVRLVDVDRVIAAMGRIEQFGDDEIAPAAATPASRRLYRDADRRIIAGVAAGLAAYLGLPSWLVRTAFVMLALIFGAAVFIYLLLWWLVPAAQSTTEKLQMRGSPLTLAAIDRGIRDRLAEFGPETRNAASRGVHAAGSLIRLVVLGAVTLLKRVMGAVVAGGASVALLVLTVLLVTALVNAGAPPLHPAVADFFGSFSTWEHAAKVFLYLIFAIPLVLVIVTAVRLFSGVRHLNTRSFAGLLGVWLFSLLMSAGIWASHYPELRERMAQRESMHQFRGGVEYYPDETPYQ